ncbi:hypothetical protein J6N69_05110 [bacterium]|nr:hypothetical protein [bacterium]
MGKIKHFTPILITLCIVFLFYIKRFVFLKFYPPICNFGIFLIFFLSLFAKETVIQKFARLCGDKLEKPALNYTLKVTYLWCGFTFINFIISVWTIFLSDNIWMIYNGFVSYLLVGVVFGVEYIVRKILQQRGII